METGHRWKYNKTHALCVLDNKVYKHTLRVFNTYCFSTATTVSLTQFCVKFYAHCVTSCSLNRDLN